MKANPNALLIPRFNVNAPDWWLEKHPGELAALSPDFGGKRLQCLLQAGSLRVGS